MAVDVESPAPDSVILLLINYDITPLYAASDKAATPGSVLPVEERKTECQWQVNVFNLKTNHKPQRWI